MRIALVGKYTGLQDSYLSVIKSLQVGAGVLLLLLAAWSRAAQHSLTSLTHTPLATRSTLPSLRVDA